MDERNETEINGFEETDDITGMRIIRCRNGLAQNTKFGSAMEWIRIVILGIAFLVVLTGSVFFIYQSVAFYVAGNTGGGSFASVFTIFGGAATLILGFPLFFMIMDVVNYKKMIKTIPTWTTEDNRAWATIKLIDYIDYTYAKDVYWAVCDVVNEEEQTIKRYESYKVKEDLFDKLNPGQEIAIYFNPDNQAEYYINLDEVR